MDQIVANNFSQKNTEDYTRDLTASNMCRDTRNVSRLHSTRIHIYQCKTLSSKQCQIK